MKLLVVILLVGYFATSHSSRKFTDNEPNKLNYYKDQKIWMKLFGYDLDLLNLMKTKKIKKIKKIKKNKKNKSRRKALIVVNEINNTPVVINSEKAFVNLLVDIYEKGRNKDLQTAIEDLVKAEEKEHLINWATPYKFTPRGQLQYLNIEFDHIPPGSANPFEDGTTEFKTFKSEAPTLAISNFDHRSVLWKKCSTTGGDNPIMKKYKEFVRNKQVACAIFANLKCIKDEENDDKVSSTNPAFERYKKGIKSLVNLHYELGSEFNPFYPKEKDLVSSAYCEVTGSSPKCSEPLKNLDGYKTVDARLVSYDGGKYYYCYNYEGCSNACGDHCKYRERNLRIDEYHDLLEWIEGGEEKKLVENCNLQENVWKDLFNDNK